MTEQTSSTKEKLPVYAQTDRMIEICKSFVGQQFSTVVEFMGRRIPITNTNLVGDLLEDVFFHGGLKDLGDFEEGPKQSSPDFYAENKAFQFEQKAFAESPGFDIANFESLISQLVEDGGLFKKMFLTKYLVFQYKILDSSVSVKSFRLLNIWQLPSYVGKRPISVQEKRGMWYNIRPQAMSTWDQSTKTPARFVNAIKECILTCSQVKDKESKIARIDEQWRDILEKYAVE